MHFSILKETLSVYLTLFIKANTASWSQMCWQSHVYTKNTWRPPQATAQIVRFYGTDFEGIKYQLRIVINISQKNKYLKVINNK